MYDSLGLYFVSLVNFYMISNLSLFTDQLNLDDDDDDDAQDNTMGNANVTAEGASGSMDEEGVSEFDATFPPWI